MSLKISPPRAKLHWFLALAFIVLITVGIFARNDWFPRTDPFTGRATGWFGVVRSAGFVAAAQPNPTPQLSKEYIYAGGKLLAVEDANANAISPADLAVWRGSTGTWWVMGGAAGSQAATQQWGTSGDVPLPGDYDGDGKTDFSVFRPSSGQWYVLQSSDNTWAPVVAWGLASDRCVPADFDGDGKTDRAVWRASSGTWYIVKSSDQASSYQTFGTQGDLPIPADYDGDGRADMAVWRSSTRTFYSQNTSNGATQSVTTTIAPGTYDWHTVSSDYDGDGRADHALYDKNTARWHICQSSDGSSVVLQWGNPGDLPVQNDYDGDGKSDLAVWRPNNIPSGTLGNWFIRQSASANSLRQVQWGIAGDIPVPAFYRR